MNERNSPFQDQFTENQSKYGGPTRDDEDRDLKLDPNVDSQEDDETMAEDTFGQNP